MLEQEFFTVAEVAKLLKVSPDTVSLFSRMNPV